MFSKEFSQSIIVFIFSTLLVASFSLLVWVVPNILTSQQEQNNTSKKLNALQLAGRDVYISEGCHVCHTQMVRPLDPEIRRYGDASKESDDRYEFPNLWGSKRTGPDLDNISRKYSDKWHELHLKNPQAIVPRSIMPPYPWLFTDILSGKMMAAKMTALKRLGVPYSEHEIAQARLEVQGHSKGEALIAYLQSLGE